jgi:hypothetical protein
MVEPPEANSTDEIEVTPEMIEAGVAAYYGSDRRFDADDEIVTRIFKSMMKAKSSRPNV